MQNSPYFTYYKDSRIKLQASKNDIIALHHVLSPWRGGNKSLPSFFFFFHKLFKFGSLSLCLLLSPLYLRGDHQSNRLYYYFSTKCFDFQPTQKINPCAIHVYFSSSSVASPICPLLSAPAYSSSQVLLHVTTFFPLTCFVFFLSGVLPMSKMSCLSCKCCKI